MRRLLAVAVILILCQPIANATDIEQDTTDDTSGTLSGTYVVKSGNTWTVSGDYEVAEGTQIHVESGANLVISGNMSATSTSQLNLAETAGVIVPVNNIGDTGIVRISFADEILYSITIEILGEVTENWTGSTFDWSGDLTMQELKINITTHPFQISSIAEITVSPQGSTPVLFAAEELSGDGTSLVIADRTNAWSIEVNGTMTVSGTIFGAGITCNGTCTLDQANMMSTGPIEVFGSISVTDSILKGGISDEDIIVWNDASVEWINSSGTGGVTDNWVNILTTRTLGVQNGYVVFYGYDMGYDGVDTSALYDNSTFEQENQGDNVIEIGQNERSRMVRWQDGNGTVHEESASGVVKLQTPWGIYEHQIAELPKTNHFEVDLGLPLLSFDSLIETDDESSVNTRLGVMATVTNSGAGTANFMTDCTSDGVDANIGLTIGNTIGPGETIEIPLNWDSPVEGELTLDCEIFVPYQFEGYTVVSPASASSGVVVWTAADDDSSVNLAIPIAIGIVLAIIGFVAVSRMRSSENAAREINHFYEDEEVN